MSAQLVNLYGKPDEENSGVCWKTVETKSLNFRSVIAEERRGRGRTITQGLGCSLIFTLPISKIKT